MFHSGGWGSMLVVKQLFHNLCFCFFLLSGHFARSAMQMKRLKVSSDYKYTDDSFVVVVVFFFQFVLLLLITFLVFYFLLETGRYVCRKCQ